MRKVNRRAVLTIIARMITDDDTYRQDFSSEEKYAENFFRHALAKETNTEALQREVIECSIALKQVVRTYNLV